MRLNKKLFAGGLVAGSVAVAGLASALWSSSGTGPSQARALSAATLTVNSATATADLYPGYTQGDLFFTVTNTNPYPVTITSMTAGAVTSSDTAACANTNVTVANASSLSLSVPAGGTSGTLTIPNVVTMITGAPDGCQGRTFSVALTLTGSQA
jgi:hypothetical protein